MKEGRQIYIHDGISLVNSSTLFARNLTKALYGYMLIIIKIMFRSFKSDRKY